MDPPVNNFHLILHLRLPTLAKPPGEVACVRFTMSLALCYQGEKETLLVCLVVTEVSFLGEGRVTRFHRGEKPTSLLPLDITAWLQIGCEQWFL